MANVSPQNLVDRHVKEHRKMEAWFEGTVRKYEKLAASQPDSYRTKVRLFGYLGYAYIFLILLLLLAAVAAVVLIVVITHRGSAAAIKFAIVILLVIAAIARSLWVKIEPPNGLPLSHADAPHLWDEVGRVADSLRAPRPDQILVDADMNAACIQTPRLGILGMYKNTLLLGMPLMLSLSPEEMRSVIAHEYGHFSGQHGRFGAWAYRVDQTWSQLRDNVGSDGRGAWLFAPFVRWFSPRFSALTFALIRQHEYEADAAAAQVSSAPTAASALMRLKHLNDKAQKAFWAPYYEQVKSSPRPPARAFATMTTALSSATPQADIRTNLELALRDKTGYGDTHPSLTDRLKALGQLPTDLDATVSKMSEPVEKSAAQEFFGPMLPKILDQLEAEHAKLIQPSWEMEHAQIAKSMQALAELEKIENPTETQEINRAGLVYRLKGNEEGEPLLRAAMEKYPNHAVPKFLLGELLLERNDTEGVPLMNEAMKLDRDFAEDGINALGAYYYRNNQMSDLESLKEVFIQASVETAVAEQASLNIDLKDDLLPPDLSHEDRVSVKDTLAKVKNLQVAYVVQRTLPGTNQVKYAVLVFPKPKMIESGNEGSSLVTEVAKECVFPFSSTIFSPPNPKAWKRRLDDIQGARVFVRAE